MADKTESLGLNDVDGGSAGFASLVIAEAIFASLPPERRDYARKYLSRALAVGYVDDVPAAAFLLRSLIGPRPKEPDWATTDAL